MTPDTPLQDAVTLAADLQRTPLQIAAKRLYDALRDAEFHALEAGRHGQDSSDLYLCAQIERDIQRVKDRAAHLLHQDDCE